MNSRPSEASGKVSASRWPENNRQGWSIVIFDMKTVVYSSNWQKMLVIVQLLVHFRIEC